MPSKEDFPQKCTAGDYQTWDPLCSGWTNDCGIQDNTVLCWIFFTDNETYRGPPFVDNFYIGNMILEDVKMWIIHGLEVGSTAEEIYFQWWNWCTGGPWCSFLSAKGIVLFNNHEVNAFTLFLLTLCALSRFDNFLIRKLKQNMGDCWQNMGASYKSMGVCCWQRERIIKHQEEFKHETYLNKLRGGQKKYLLSLLKYVKIRRTLVQLKQFKKIKPLSECNFPYFTLESKFQTKSPNPKKAMSHNFLCIDKMSAI